MAGRLGTQRVKVKSFDEIMAEKRQRALQKKNEPKKKGEAAADREEKPNVVKMQMSKQKDPPKLTTSK